MNQKPLVPAPVSPAQAGFTLVEIMVVIVILGLLATLVVQNVVGASDEARMQTAKTNCTTIAGAVRLFRAQKGKLPESLDALVTKDEKGMSYLEELQKDPWGNAYEIREGNNPNEWEIISLGPDGASGTEDDISSKSTKDK
jgi:general secretion pathway protein G